MTFRRLPYSVLLTLTLLTAPRIHAQSPPGPDFNVLRKSWVHCLETRDLQASLAAYASDATFTNPDGTHASGKELRQLYETVFKTFRAKITMTPRASEFSGNLAYEGGSYDETVTLTGSGERKHFQGDYLTVYRHTGKANWLIVQQVWTAAPGK
jgi:ketosteroid isomerase-like protein